MAFKYSIVVPVYNAENFVGECLDSILGQGRDDVEIIVVDDDSSDGTPAILDGYQARHPECVTVIHKENEGPLISRGIGFSLGKGSYLMSVDADDQLLPGAFDVIDAIIDKTDADIVLIGSTRDAAEFEALKGQGSATIEDVCTLMDKRAFLHELCNVNTWNPIWSKVVKASCAAKDFDYAPHAKRNNNEDFFQTVVVCDRAETFCFANQVLYHYRVNASSTTMTKYDRVHYDNTLYFLDAAEPFAKKWERELDEDGYVLGLEFKKCVAHVAYASYLALERDVEALCALRDSAAFKARYAYPGVREVVPRDWRAVLWLVEHGIWTPIRVRALALASARGARNKLFRRG